MKMKRETKQRNGKADKRPLDVGGDFDDERTWSLVCVW